MQKRHTDRKIYFKESSNTSREFYIPYIEQVHDISGRERILEIGCGEGGNLYPFSQLGCRVTGIDIASCRVKEAQQYFRENHSDGSFLQGDFLEVPVPDREADLYDVILLHDVIEHIADKQAFLSHIKGFLKKDGVLFVAFPAWQMPFGGHQQICRNRAASKIPFVHLLPYTWYAFFLRHVACEKADTVHELLDIRKCRTSIECFESVMESCRYHVLNRQLWLVNPHYKQKFHLHPRKLSPFVSRIKYLRDFFSTSCFYLLQ